MVLPLEGIRVLDFSRLLPGPWCTQFLSDLGAEVVKLERPGEGDMSRHQPPVVEDRSVYFASLNTGKESIAVDLSRPEGHALATRLIGESDVVVESFRPGLMKSLGLDYEAARAVKPDIVYCSITGFGQTGPLASVSGHDLAIQCMTGIMGVELDRGGVAAMPQFQAADYAAATVACIGILSALMRRSKSGEGAYLDIAMFDALFSMSNVAMMEAFSRESGQPGFQRAEIWGGNPRYAIYRAADGGAVAVALLERRLWEAFCTMIERPDLINPAETPQDRLGSHGDYGPAYRAVLTDYCAARSRDRIVSELTAHGIPVQPVYTPAEALRTDNIHGRGLLDRTEDPRGALGPQLVNPLARSGLARSSRTLAPALGADTAAVIARLGLPPEDIDGLHARGVIAGPLDNNATKGT